MILGLRGRTPSGALARVTATALVVNCVMVGTPASGTSRRDKGGQTATSLATPRNGIATNKTAINGRVTPVRIRNGDSNFVNANAAWGFETPTNKILSNVPSTVTIRSSERRRRVKADGSDESISGDKPLGTAFVDSRFTKVRTPTPEPRMLERSNSNASANSEYGFQPRKLAKVSSFCSDRPLTTPLQPTINKENFFHAKDYKEKLPPSSDSSDKFFFASSKAKNAQPIAPTNTSHQRRLSTSSQYSSFSTAKEICPSNGTQYTIPPPANPSNQPRSPVSPTKTTFFHTSNSTAPPSPLVATIQSNVPLSPLRSSVVIRTPVETIKLSPEHISQKQAPPHDSHESILSSLNSSAQIELSSDTSEDDLATKSLLPSTADLENSARINRKVISSVVYAYN